MNKQKSAQETPQSERKRPRSAKAIQESEEWLFTTLQSIGDAVIATDEKGFIVFMNAVAVQLTGWSEDEAQGHDCSEVFRIIGETTRLETESPVTKVMRDGVISGLANHTILIARNGTEHSIDDSGSPIRDQAGVLIGIVLIFRDVTSRRNAEKTFSEQKEVLQTLFDHLPVLVAFLDEGGQFKWTNREWQRVMGRSLEGITQNHAESSSVHWTQPKWHDVHLTGKEGRPLDITWASIRMSDGSYIGIGQDITGRKAYEATIEARNYRLEQAMQETDHRVKNNLQSVGALLDMQTMTDSETIPVAGLTQIRMHINALTSIHEMLVQDVKDHFMPATISARNALRKLVPLLEQTVGPPRIPWSADEIALSVKQSMSLAVLVNELVSNAVKHGSSQVELRLAAGNAKVTLEVCDNGPGFGDTFDPKKAANFGLELIESVSRIDLGGQTTYLNRPEGGACVTVTFPFLPQQAA